MSHVKNTAIALAALSLLALAGSASAQQSCVVSRADVEKQLAKGLTSTEIAAKYAGCTAADLVAATTTESSGLNAIFAKANEISTPEGSSTTFEALEACGYHPQREEAVCVVEIRRPDGFGGPICQSFGSTLWALLCVDYNDGMGLVPVHIGSVHVHDAMTDSPEPPWDFGLVIQADPRLVSLPNVGFTLAARVILSWAAGPDGCSYQPVWGNQADFKIRLDP